VNLGSVMSFLIEWGVVIIVVIRVVLGSIWFGEMLCWWVRVLWVVYSLCSMVSWCCVCRWWVLLVCCYGLICGEGVGVCMIVVNFCLV